MDNEIDAWINKAQLREAKVGPRVQLLRKSISARKEQEKCISSLKHLAVETDFNRLQAFKVNLPPPL